MATQRTVPLHALLIEDDVNDQHFFQSALVRCGAAIELHVAETVERAATVLERVRPDVIFADLHLPGVPASEFLHWLRQRDEFSPVWLIAVTGDLGSAGFAAGLYGADTLLVKPVAVEDLRSVVTLTSTPKPARL